MPLTTQYPNKCVHKSTIFNIYYFNEIKMVEKVNTMLDRMIYSIYNYLQLDLLTNGNKTYILTLFITTTMQFP